MAAEGIVHAGSHEGLGYIFELNTETDFVARNKRFHELIDHIKRYLRHFNGQETQDLLASKLDGITLDDLIKEYIGMIGEKIVLSILYVFRKHSDEYFQVYNHANQKISVICIFTGDEAEIKNIGNKVAMHIAAMNPSCIGEKDLSSSFIEHERSIILDQIKHEPGMANKPTEILDRIVKGRLQKIIDQTCLNNQDFVVEPGIKVGEYLKKHNLKLITMMRLALGS